MNQDDLKEILELLDHGKDVDAAICDGLHDKYNKVIELIKFEINAMDDGK